MKIEICKTAGLCGGATRSYNAVIEALKAKKQVKMYHQILHNQKLIDNLTNRGASIIYNINDASKDDHVILKAHGEKREVFKYLNDNKIAYTDTICPNVKRVHEIALKKEAEGYSIILVGKKSKGGYHAEISALISYLKDPIIISELDELSKIEFKNTKYFMVSQTTFNNEKFQQILLKAREILTKENKEFDYENTICNFPLLNIRESLVLAKKCDISVVLGSKNSSNTTELYNSVKDVCYTIFSDNFTEIKKNILDYSSKNSLDMDKLKLCILAGASTLKTDLIELKEYLEVLNK